jgi:hypothetical protein
MAVADDIKRVFREFRRYTGDGLPGAPVNAPLPIGDPQSGVHSPKKADIRQAFVGLADRLETGIETVEGAIPAIEQARDAAIADVGVSRDAAMAVVGASTEAAENARDLAIQAADLAAVVGAGDVPTYATRALAAASNIPAARTYLLTGGYAAPGDGGSALYKRLQAEPSPVESWHFQSADGAWWELAESRIDVKMLGAVADGATPAAAFLNAAIARGGEVIIPPGTYILEAPLTPPSNTVIRALGRVVLKAQDGSAAAPLLLHATEKNNITVIGIEFDGNMPNIGHFNAAAQTYRCERVVFERCRFVNVKGIAFYNGDSKQCGIRYCSFENCGTYNRTTGNLADRRQAFASSFGNRSLPQGGGNFALFSTFKDVGLDCISFASGDDDGLIQGNRIRDNDAGSIYVSNSTRMRILDNNITNGANGGNAIDTNSPSDTVISGNVCVGNGAAGILVGANAKRVTVTGNVCKSNWQSKSSSHRGGITFHAPAGSEMSEVIVSGNVCDDDQGAATTQNYAIGVVAGGTYRNVRIAKDNVLTWRTAAGAVDHSGTFQTPGLGVQPYPMFWNLNDQAEIILCPDSVRGKLTLYQVNGNYHAEILLRTGAAPVELIDPSTQWEVADTGTTNVVYRDAGTGTIRLKNRTGLTRGYMVSFDGTTA